VCRNKKKKVQARAFMRRNTFEMIENYSELWEDEGEKQKSGKFELMFGKLLQISGQTLEDWGDASRRLS
jgi:hypothetical protein